MHQDLQGTMIIISHQERILNIADEIIMIGGGSVMDRGPGPEMLRKMLTHEAVHQTCCSRKEFFHE